MVQGLDVSFSMDNSTEISKGDAEDSETQVKGYSGQVHVFF